MEQYIGSAPMILVLFFLVAGFVLLVKGADFFVEGSSAIAKRFRVPSVIVGLTVVAMGTSLPELAVSVTASMAQANELSISNVIGSNIFNTMVVVGVCGFLCGVPASEETVKRDIPFSAFCAITLLVLGATGLAGTPVMTLGRIDGAISLFIFVLYMWVLIKNAMASIKRDGESRALNDDGAGDNEDSKILALPLSLLFIVGGAIAIVAGGDMTVEAASRIALELGMSQTLVGLTIVSIGTSLPELVTSIVAARKNEVEMALGNAIGSNVFNVLMVLGVSSLVSPMELALVNIKDLAILIVFTLIVWIFAWRNKNIDKKEGLSMILMYVVYTAYIIKR